MNPTVHIVETRAQLIAAIKCVAQETDVLARAHPAAIRIGKTRYIFTRGLSVKRAKEVLRNIRRVPATAFGG